MPNPRYYNLNAYGSLNNPAVANPSLSSGMFTPAESLHVDARNLSDAGQYGIAAPTVPSGYDHAWDNGYGQPQVQYADPMQRAAQYGRAPVAPEDDADLLQLRATQNAFAQQDANKGKSRYDVFANLPQNANLLEPQRIARYQAIYGATPNAEATLQYQRIKQAEELKNKPLEEIQKRHAAIAHELGFNPEVLLNSIEGLPAEKRRPGQMVSLPGHSIPDPIDPTKMIDVPGRPVYLTPRLLQTAYGMRSEADKYFPKGEVPQDSSGSLPSIEAIRQKKAAGQPLTPEEEQHARGYMELLARRKQSEMQAARRSFSDWATQ